MKALLTIGILMAGIFGGPLRVRADDSLLRLTQVPLSAHITRTPQLVGADYALLNPVSVQRTINVKRPGVLCLRWEWPRRAQRSVPQGVAENTAFFRFLAPAGTLIASDAAARETDLRLDIGPHACAAFPVVGTVHLDFSFPAQTLVTALSGEAFYPVLAVYWSPSYPRVNYVNRHTGELTQNAGALEPWTAQLWLPTEQPLVGNIDILLRFFRGTDIIGQCFFDGSSPPIHGMYRCVVPSEAVYYVLTGPTGTDGKFPVLGRGAEWD